MAVVLVAEKVAATVEVGRVAARAAAKVVA